MTGRAIARGGRGQARGRHDHGGGRWRRAWRRRREMVHRRLVVDVGRGLTSVRTRVGLGLGRIGVAQTQSTDAAETRAPAMLLSSRVSHAAASVRNRSGGSDGESGCRLRALLSCELCCVLGAGGGWTKQHRVRHQRLQGWGCSSLRPPARTPTPHDWHADRDLTKGGTVTTLLVHEQHLGHL
jgi:hypothetical protein